MLSFDSWACWAGSPLPLSHTPSPLNSLLWKKNGTCMCFVVVSLLCVSMSVHAGFLSASQLRGERSWSCWDLPGAEQNGQCWQPKRNTPSQESCQSRNSILWHQPLVYISSEYREGIFSGIRWRWRWGRVTEGMEWLTGPIAKLYLSNSGAETVPNRSCWVTPIQSDWDRSQNSSQAWICPQGQNQGQNGTQHLPLLFL